MQMPRSLMQYQFNDKKNDKSKVTKAEFWDDVGNKSGATKGNCKNDSSVNVSAQTNCNSNENDWIGNFDTPRFIPKNDDGNYKEEEEEEEDDNKYCQMNTKGMDSKYNKINDDDYLTFEAKSCHIPTIKTVKNSNNYPSSNNNNNNQKQRNVYTYTNSHTISTTTAANKKIEADHLFSKTSKINNARAEKFNNFINKYNNPKENSTRVNPHSYSNTIGYSNGNSNNYEYSKPNPKKRTENLYAHAQMKIEYLERLRFQEKEKKIRKEVNQCTFWPKINKKSKSLASERGNSQEGNFYDRNISWANNKCEKIHNQQKKKINELESYSFKPNLSLRNKDYNSKKSNDSSNISTALYFERQEKARQIKSHQSDRSSRTKYRSCSTEPSSNNKMKKMFMSQWKAVLHEELFNSDDINNEEIWTNY